MGNKNVIIQFITLFFITNRPIVGYSQTVMKCEVLQEIISLDNAMEMHCKMTAYKGYDLTSIQGTYSAHCHDTKTKVKSCMCIFKK